MINDKYSECDQCLENNIHAQQIVGKNDHQLIEDQMRKKYKVKSIYELLDYDLPKDIKMDIINNIKPEGPGDSTQWLNGSNVNQCLMRIFKKFKTMEGGVEPFVILKKINKEPEERIPKYFSFNMRDFAGAGGSLNDLWLDKSFNCFGTIINTDYSWGDGIHWLSIFVNLIKEPYTLEYFDSGGSKMLPEIYEFFKTLKSLIIKIYKPTQDVYILNVTNVVQQNDKHSCGVYALYYVYARLQGIPWKYFRENIIGDHKMHKFRKHLFRLNS